MSRRYLGGFITANPTIPTASSASGAWTISQQLQYASTWPFGGPFNYIEDVFSTWLYTGNSSTQNINNGIDLATKGGLVWQKVRNTAGYDHVLTDTTTSGTGSLTNYLSSNTTNSFSSNQGNIIGSYNSNGFTLNSGSGISNVSGTTNVSWTFRKQPKFFDVVTYTGNGGTQNISHNLGSVPGMIIVKCTDVAGRNWNVYHRSTGADNFLRLNTTDAIANNTTIWNNTAPTATQFTVGNLGAVNGSGNNYVAYLFAHNAGGFGLTGADNVISCGSFTTDGSGIATVNLGYEPQWVMVKQTSPNTGAWFMFDNMRGMAVQLGGAPYLRAESSNAETADGVCQPQSTGFLFNGSYVFGTNSSATFIYMAIRRGPMAVPTLGTSVFSPSAVNVSAGTAITTGFPIDWQINYYRSFAANYNSINATRLLGTSSTSAESGQVLWTAKTDAEQSFGMTRSWDNTGFQQTSQLWPNINNIYWNFRRAPGFFDIVCYTGTGSSTTYAHNLGVVPQMIIYRARGTDAGTGGQWAVLTSDNSGVYYFQLLNSNLGNIGTYTPAATIGLTASTFNPSPVGWNTSSVNYVAYLFASVAGVSKVGSYTGTGSTQTINAGLPTGARFVLIKRTDSTGDWWVWDTARGMVSGTDPRLALNSTNAEINNNWVYTTTNGFQIVTTDATVNASGGSYIYLAIA